MYQLPLPHLPHVNFASNHTIWNSVSVCSAIIILTLKEKRSLRAVAFAGIDRRDQTHGWTGYRFLWHWRTSPSRLCRIGSRDRTGCGFYRYQYYQTGQCRNGFWVPLIPSGFTSHLPRSTRSARDVPRSSPAGQFHRIISLLGLRPERLWCPVWRKNRPAGSDQWQWSHYLERNKCAVE